MKFFDLSFIKAFRGANVQNGNSYRHNILKSTTQTSTNVVNLNVGGIKYSLFDEDIRKHSGSFFEQALNDRKLPGNMDVDVMRDGNAFKFVNAFMVSGHLPSNLDADTVSSVKAEADFYRLPALKDECDAAMINDFAIRGGAAPNISLFSCVALKAKTVPLRNADQQYPVHFVQDGSTVYGALRQIIAPLCTTREINNDRKYFLGKTLLKSSTATKPNVTELIEAAQCLQGETPHNDTNVYSIPTVLLSRDAVESACEFLSCSKVLAVGYNDKDIWKESQLLVQTPGSENYTHKPSRIGHYLGSLHAVLNSPFEGGELKVSLGEQHTSVNVSKMHWSAVHGDCTQTISPVTSGARVSIIYDLYAPPGGPVLNNAAPWHTLHEKEEEHGAALYRAAHDVPQEMKQRLFDAVDAELDDHDSIDVALHHLYPECHNTPVSALQRSDRALCDLLGEKYYVQVVAIIIRFAFDCGTCAGLYLPPGILPTASIRPEGKSKLFLPKNLTERHLLDEFVPDIEERAFVYLVSALRVFKK